MRDLVLAKKCYRLASVCNLLIFQTCIIQVFHTAYAYYFRPGQLEEIREVIVDCVRLLHKSYPHLKEKVKVHMLLHLIEDMENFGPAVSFCTER